MLELAKVKEIVNRSASAVLKKQAGVKRVFSKPTLDSQGDEALQITIVLKGIGVTQRTASRYALVYRSIDHRTLKDLCVEERKPTPSAKYAGYFPIGGFGANVQAFSTAVIELQETRHLADYDPRPRFSTSEAKLAVGTARSAIGRFLPASEEHRKAFLTLLVCPPR